MKKYFTLLICIINVLYLASCTSTAKGKLNAQVDLVKKEVWEDKERNSFQEIKIDDYSKLVDFLNSSNVNLDEIRKTKKVPFLLTKNIKASIKKLTISDKKNVFIKVLLPNILLVNHEILEGRKRIKSILGKEVGQRSEEEKMYLDSLRNSYSLKVSQADELLNRHDILPASLVISQAILESGWGTSKFSIYGNSLFGLHTTATAKGTFIQAEGSSIKLKAYTSIKLGIEGYLKNINRHRAYRGLRAIRKKCRDENGKLNSIEMAKTQKSYSELGSEYISRVVQIIKAYKLDEFDDAKLSMSDTRILLNITE